MGFRRYFENSRKGRYVVLFLFFSISSFAQLSDLHYLPPLKQDANNRAVERQAVYISTPETTPFTVRAYRGISLTPVATFSVSNASPVTYNLANGDNNITMVTNANTGIVLTNAGLRFESDNNELFYINYRSSSNSQAASLTSKGRQALGRNFKWGGVPNRSASPDLTTSLGIMASEDNTTVTLSGYDPDCVFRLQNNASGITDNSLTINLNRGESYVLEAKTTAATANIEGWLGASISSDRDIAISHGGLNYGFAVPGSRDSGIDQPVPENRIGKEYIFIRGNGIDLTETPIIIATQNNTDVFVNGATTPIVTLNDGDYFLIPGSNYSSSTPGANMLVTTSKDAYAYQNLAGAAGEQTIGLNFVAPVNCLLADNLNNIPNITDAAGITLNGGITIIASTTTPNANIVVNDGSGIVALPAPNFVTGSTVWKTFFIPDLVGNVSVQSTGPIAVGFFGVNDDRGIAGYFSGFDTVPVVDLQLTGAGCIPGGDLEVADPNFDAYQWYDNDGISIPGATSSIYTPTVAGDYFVRVTKGGCTYDSQPLSAYYCDPDIKLTKTADVSEALEGDTVNFTVTVESLGVDPVTNLVITELADGFTIISASPSVGSWSDPDWTIGTINAGDLETIDIVATIDELPNNSPSLIRTNTVVNAQDQVDHDITTDQPSADIDVDNDSDLDGIVDNDDLDDDNDGIPDSDEGDFDSDGDGLNNRIDLDSDNDGIYDIEEAGHLRPGTNGTVNGSVGTNGLPDLVETSPDSGTRDYVLAESTDDTDTIAHFLDLDSDGDGIPDNVEAQSTLGYIPPHADDAATYATNRGVNSAYLGGLTPENTDGTDNPDYLDLDSDNEGHSDTTEAGITLAGEDSDGDGLDDGIDTDTVSYSDPGGTIDNPLTMPLQLLDTDNDAASGGDVDFRDAIDDRPDNDNDGIVDALDFDDDNDGILDTDEGCGNFIINGSFEQDDFTDASAYPNGFTSANGTFIGTTYNTNILTAWNYTQNMDGWVEGGAFGPAPFADAYHGSQYLDIIGNNSVTGGVSNIVSQTADLEQGQSYVLTFFWGEDIGHQSGDLVTLEMDVIDGNGTAIFDETFTTVALGNASGTSGPKSWFYVERTFTATTNDVTVQFSSVPDAPKTSVGAALDYVVLVHSVPSDCLDTDNDGIPDAMDLDSDNDGIYDAVEAGHGAAHTNGILNGTVGADGVPDSVQDDPDRETVNYIPLDSDGDTELDVRESDSDGDGCFDVIEAGLADGDADGVLGNSPVNVDANGLVTSAIDGYTFPLDADNNGVLDYREAGRTPIIDTQPTDNTVCSDRSVSFTVTTTDADAYQWQLFDGSNWNDLTDGGIYSGTATATLQMVNVPLTENGNRYRAVVSNTALACGILNSEEVTLTVAETPDITLGDAQETEGGTIRFPVTLSSLSCLAEDISLTFTFTDGSADRSDYTDTNVQITIPAGSLTVEVAVQTTPDEIDEGDETFTISIASVDAGTVNDFSDTATGTILDDDTTDIDSDDDGILDSFEDLNADGDNDPATDPTNSDGDLYPDYLDIDSDNDGIPDNVEAQTTSGYIPPSLQDANANGLDDAYEQGVRMGLIPINTDGEDVPDYLDADSDNDNVPDAIEGHDHDHDGRADVSFVGSDKDNDGLDDGYEGAVQIDSDVNDEIDQPAIDLPNTDGDGESDYRDIDDDNDGIPTREEDANADRNYANDDVDSDGTPDYLEPNYPEVEVFNVVTPNDDTVHDYLIISGLDIRPNNSIRIFNRWGVLVYETKSYDSHGNRFDGTSQARATYGKEEKLPAGTYFYMLDYEDLEGGFKTLSGHLYLN